MYTNSGAPYQIEKTLSATGGGHGRGFIVTHRPTEVGALVPSLEDAVAWMDADARYRAARAERDRALASVGVGMASGIRSLELLTLEAEFRGVGL